jgi:hypothetical protein
MNKEIREALGEINARFSDMVEKHGGRFCMLVGFGTPKSTDVITDSWSFHHSKNWDKESIHSGLDTCRHKIQNLPYSGDF